jgi:hypothetical protein
MLNWVIQVLILLELFLTHNLPLTSSKLSSCNDCNKAKAHVLSFIFSSCYASSPLEVIHSDLWGPSLIVSSNGFKYYVHFIDEYF